MQRDIIEKLKEIVGPHAALADDTELMVYECDALALFKHRPDIVVFPKSAQQVAEIVKLANLYGIPFLPRGAGTGLSGGAMAAEGGILIELQRMNRILS